jgi:hypothetical protein
MSPISLFAPAAQARQGSACGGEGAVERRPSRALAGVAGLELAAGMAALSHLVRAAAEMRRELAPRRDRPATPARLRQALGRLPSWWMAPDGGALATRCRFAQAAEAQVFGGAFLTITALLGLEPEFAQRGGVVSIALPARAGVGVSEGDLLAAELTQALVARCVQITEREA